MKCDLGFETEVRIPPRPKRGDQPIVQAAAKTLAKDIRNWIRKFDPLMEEPNSTAQQAALECLSHTEDDGYRLAKHLEENYKFIPNTQLVHLLAKTRRHAEDARREAERKWVQEFQIEPHFTKGQTVEAKVTPDQYPYATSIQGTIKGQIAKVLIRSATYRITILDKNKYRQLECGYEAVTLAP